MYFFYIVYAVILFYKVFYFVLLFVFVIFLMITWGCLAVALRILGVAIVTLPPSAAAAVYSYLSISHEKG